MRKPKKALRPPVHKSRQADVFPLEVEHLLDVLARIEARRQLRLRALELERNEGDATSEIPS